MRPLFRLLTVWLLTLLLAAGGALTVPLMARAPSVGLVELCVGDRVELVAVNADGVPVAPHPPCFHCLACGDVGLLAFVAPAGWVAGPSEGMVPGYSGAAGAVPAHMIRVRGPPVV